MTHLKMYNTLTKKIENFYPGGKEQNAIEKYPEVTIYSCGPTVYSYAHIGNFRTFMMNDLLRRYLKFKGFKVNHTVNITDVDDKTINGAKENKMSLKEYTEKYTDIFFKDLEALNIEKAEHYPKATDSIEAMEDIITKLEEKDLTYEKDGSIYFNLSNWDNYGQLNKLDKQEFKSGIRYDTDEYSKDDIRDFVLWKAPKDENEPSWNIKQGTGRPGWHIECSAMIRKIYEKTIDIHTGGEDLIFPHHENEIAQSEAAYNEKFVRYWIHGRHLFVEGSKMSKSKGNFFTLNDLIEKGYNPRAIRFTLLSAHYRKQLNFTMHGIESASQPLSRIDNFISRLNNEDNSQNADIQVNKICLSFIESFTNAMDNDLNISGATGHLFDFIHDINSIIDSKSISNNDSVKVMETLKQVDSVLGYIFFSENSLDEKKVEEIEKLIQKRNQAKVEKDYSLADRIRDDLSNEGIILEDGKDGTTWKKK